LYINQFSKARAPSASTDISFNTSYNLLHFFFSFGFRSSTEKVSKTLLFQAQIMICSWKKNIFFQIKNIFDSKKTTSLAPLNLFFFRVFVLKNNEMLDWTQRFDILRFILLITHWQKNLLLCLEWEVIKFYCEQVIHSGCYRIVFLRVMDCIS
jgi:hypothetical protein